MSVRVRDLLKLPTMSRSHVVAGEVGLDRVVSTVSVIDFTATSVAQRELYQPENSANEQLLLTSIDHNYDVVTDCRQIEQLAKNGCVGVVVYYVGDKVPTLPPKIKETADQLNFLIIFAQETQKNLSYSAVISEIMFAIFQDRMRHPSFAPTIIGRVSAMPEYRRSVGEVLKLLAAEIDASLAIIDNQGGILYRETWPKGTAVNWENLLNVIEQININGELPVTTTDGMKITHWQLSNSPYTVLIISRQTVTNLTCERVAETLQTALNLWGNQSQDDENLIRAIIQGQIVRAAQLGRQYRFDLKDTQAALVISCPNNVNKSKLKKWVDQLTLRIAGHMISDWYNDQLIVLLEKSPSYQEWQSWESGFKKDDQQLTAQCVVVSATMVDGFGGIQRLYQLVSQYMSAAQTILPHRSFFNQADLEFARGCQRELQEEGTEVIRWQKRLDAMQHNLVETLLTFLLDTPQNIEQAGNLLYVHRNTIKYRLNKISNRFGFVPGVMPESFELYQALGVHRLLRGNEDADELNESNK